MSDAFKLAALLSRRGALAIPTQDGAVRTWVAGTGRGVLRVTPGWAGAEAVWVWQRDGRRHTHPSADTEGAARVIDAFMRADPPP